MGVIGLSDNSFDSFLLLTVVITFNNMSHFYNEIRFPCKICTFYSTYFSSMLHVRYLGTNSPLYDLPESQITKLQRIQNSAARVVTLSQKNMITQLQLFVNYIDVLSSIVMYKFCFLYTNVSLILHLFIFKNLSRNINLLEIFALLRNRVLDVVLRKPNVVDSPSLWQLLNYGTVYHFI